ncbi:salicylate hydroxylase [Talaromyces proteolyticus]|uniref:Salicylate hydroxylase n=1 Tax=Talaromyces proteolyticus TaxID=1131652 RepID=A0AAD4KTS3_9EURO|nr:salicylate hydroxylase [Talaromyces proteolyticus]KAH8699121.1 salicylate hydroxylase [Talaromyces proteolyticus]
MPFATKLKVAIIGAGPAGLGAAIELNKLEFVEWRVYEQATAIREIGAGISIQPSTWRLLEILGAAKNFHSRDIYRPIDNHAVQHRNGRTGELLSSHGQVDTPLNQLHARTLRSTLQQALLKEVNPSKISVAHRLLKVIRSPSGRLSLRFENGHTDDVDLIVGADGVRSVVRNFIFPEHKISYTGRTSYRAVVNEEDIAHLNIPDAVTFWHGPNSWLYTCGLGSGKYELTSMGREPEKDADKVSWGQDATVEQHTQHFQDFSPIVRQVAEFSKDIKQYAMFAGPKLKEITALGSVVLVGDASHPLSGAFGSGAGFALEDVYTLGQSLKWAHEKGLSVKAALNLVDRIRSPHYARLYAILDEYAATDKSIRSHDPPLSFDDAVSILIAQTWSRKGHWIYNYKIADVCKDAIEVENARLSGNALPDEVQDGNAASQFISVQESAKL